MDNERNEHFQGSADHLYTKICKLPGIHIETDRPEQEAAIPRLIAQYAYDLVYHALYCNGVDARYWPGKPQQASDYYKRQIAKATNDVPDPMEWPTSQ